MADKLKPVEEYQWTVEDRISRIIGISVSTSMPDPAKCPECFFLATALNQIYEDIKVIEADWNTRTTPNIEAVMEDIKNEVTTLQNFERNMVESIIKKHWEG
jgi:hypothetical protein